MPFDSILVCSPVTLQTAQQSSETTVTGASRRNFILQRQMESKKQPTTQSKILRSGDQPTRASVKFPPQKKKKDRHHEKKEPETKVGQFGASETMPTLDRNGNRLI